MAPQFRARAAVREFGLGNGYIEYNLVHVSVENDYAIYVEPNVWIDPPLDN